MGHKSIPDTIEIEPKLRGKNIALALLFFWGVQRSWRQSDGKVALLMR